MAFIVEKTVYQNTSFWGIDNYNQDQMILTKIKY